MSTATLTHSAPFLATLRELFAGWFQAQPMARTATAARSPTCREEADELRAMANDLMSSDPAFAQDLYAATDRHEGLE